MGGLFGGTPKPKASPPVPPAAAPATVADSQVAGTAAASRARAAAAAGSGFAGTIATSPQGLNQQTPTAQTSLLGGTS